MKAVVAFLTLLTAGCDLIPRKVEMSDPELQPMLKAAASFDRAAFGFSPIPKKADVRLELRTGLWLERWLVGSLPYDAMLHIYAKTSRTIAFRKTDEGYRWIGEQEVFQGPQQFTNVDGTFYERVFLSYEVEEVAGYLTNVLRVSYFGEDPRLAHRHNLTLDDVNPILKEWGY